MAVRVKREPGSSVGAPPLDSSPSPRICYVCGAIGAAYSLNCRIRERGSYFPFLEQHDVPQGAARPTAEGVVISCMLCYSFLNQQWESYERNQTPHSKRLYWLKRADNGHYLGAEMRLQGEYASQIIGVSPEPGVGTGSGSLSNQHTHCTPLSNTAAVLRQPASGRCASVPHHQRGAATPQSTEDYYTSRDRCDSRSNSMVTYPVAPDDQEESYDSSSGLLDLRSGIGKTPNEASARNSRSKEGVDRTAVGDECSLSSSHPSSRKAEAPFGTSPANGALDLSMPDKNAATEACYMCGEEVLRGTLVSVYAKPIANCPFFPSLMLHPRPSHSRPMDPSGCVQACAPCYQHLLQQWDVFQRQNVPHAERRYQLWKRSASSLSLRTPSRPSAHCSSPSAPPPCLPTDFICFLCGQEFPWNLRHILYSGPNPEGEPPLPFLERVKPSRGAIPLSATGQALSCSDCYRAVHRQRHAYMDSLRSALSDEVPRSQGVFPKPLHSGAREEDSAPTVSTGRSNSSNVDVILPCHLCHQMIPRRRLRFSDVLFNKENIHTFLPTGIQEDGDGFPICLSCCNVLMAQWEQFEEGSVQYPQRRYVTPQLSDDRKMAGNGRLTDRDNGAIISSSSAPHVNMALRIKVPSPEQDEIHSGHSSSHVGAPLLTTVSTTSDSPVSVNSVGHVSVRNNVPLPSVSFSSALDLSSGSGGGSIKRRSLPPGGSSPQPPPNACGLPGSSVRKPHVFPNNERGTVCYVCGLRCKGSRTYIVRSFPLKVSQTPSSTSPDALTVSQMAFFPFLTMHLPPQDTETGGEDGTFITCTFCYHSLMIQWAAYEASRHPQDQNPWSRTYNCHDYVCYVCGVTTYRKRVKAISVADFPFLVSHPRPPHSLVLDGGDGVVVCLMCYETLSAQWNDFERMKVPLELRKYNWIAAPPPPEDEETPSATVGQLTINGDSSSVHRHAIEDGSEPVVLSASSSRQDSRGGNTPPQQHSIPGVVQGSKAPPPLTSMPPAISQKSTIRTPVTVPPLSQVSPNGSLNPTVGANQAHGNARTSSFAAALRKLAEQVTEPIVDKDLSPVSPASSPCSTPTVKRGVLSNNGNSHPGSNSYPPSTVAVPPPQSSLNYIDGRKSLERVVVVQSRDGNKGSYEESSRKINNSNSRLYGEVSKEDNVSEAPALRGNSTGSHSDRRDVDMSPAKGPVSSFLTPLHSNDTLHNIKMQGSSSNSAYYGDRGREDQSHPFTVNGLSTPQELQHLRPQHHSSSLSSRLEETHLASSSSFQPYRSASDDLRHGLPPHMPSTYESTPPYSYHPAAFLPPHLQHPSFRLDDQLYLERYGVLRSPLFPLPHPGVLPPPPPHAMPFVPGARYAPELLAHSLSLVSPTGHHLLAQERFKLEEHHQRRERELEIYQEQERRREREREREREKEREASSDLILLSEQEKGLKSPWPHNNRRAESPARASGIGSIIQGTPRDQVIRSTSNLPSSTSQQVSSSSPPNLSSSLLESFSSKSSSSVCQPSWSGHYFSRPSVDPYLDQNDSKAPSRDVQFYPTTSHVRTRSPPLEIEKAYESTGPPIKVEATGREPVEGGTARRSSLSLIGNSKVQPAVSSTAHRRYSVAAPNEAGLSKIMKLPPDLIPNRMTENVSHSSRNSRRCAVVESSNDNDKRTSTHLAESFLNMGPSCPPEPVNSRITEYETGVTTTRSDRHHHFQSRPVIAPLFTPPLLPPPPPPIPAVAITTVATVVSTAAIVTITATIPTTTTVVVNAGPVVACQVGIPSCPRISPPRENNHVETRWNTESAASTKPVGNSSEDGVKSKLDLVIERARLKKRGIDDDGLEDMDDEDAAEENRISRLITIFSGPPLPLDTSKEKVSFLSMLGLTTQKRKREVELDNYIRRHHKFQDVILNPIEFTSTCENASPLWFLNHDLAKLKYNPDELCNEPNYQQKVCFLQHLDLNPVTRSKREENEEILKAIIEEKIKRNGFIFPSMHKFNRSSERDENHPPSLLVSEVRSLTNRSSKRKASGDSTSLVVANNSKSARVTSLLSSSKRKRAMSPLHKNNEFQGSANDIPFSVTSGPSKNVVVMNQSNKVPPASGSLLSHQEVSSRVWQVCGRDFAHEFHESVLLQTQQQKLKSKKAESQQQQHHHNTDSNEAIVTPKLEFGRITPSSAFLNSYNSPDRGNGHLKWPGIEVLMEAYERHQQDQKFEKEVLLEQYSRLKMRNQELNNIAESLSQNMSDLILVKKDVDEERERHQRAIDHLKCFLKQMR